MENGKGSVFKRSDGRWVAKVFDPRTGKYQMGYESTQNKANERLRTMLNRVESKKSPLDSKVKVAVYAEKWLKERAGERRTPSTVNEYRSRFKVHIEPVIGQMRIDRVLQRDIESVLDAVAKKGRSRGTVKSVLNAMGAMFSDAERDRLIAVSPVKGALMPLMAPTTRSQDPTTIEVRALLETFAECSGDAEAELGRIIVMCAHTGARIGEVLASKWSDIDLESGIWDLSRTTTKDVNGRVTVGKRTKTGDVRQVELTDELVTALKVQRDFVAYRQSMTRLWNSEDWVFPSTIGTVKDAHNLRRLLKETAPDWNYTFHGLRRWFVSVGLLSAGVGMAQVSRLVGHRSIKTTTDTYNYLLVESSRKVLDSVSTALKPKAL